nr:hypothetical protein GCM10025732_35730 [Glycomyces mayteni]
MARGRHRARLHRPRRHWPHPERPRPARHPRHRPAAPGGPQARPGPPKRFAQAIGVAFSATSALLLLVFDADLAGWIVLAALTAAATLESALGFCLGCKIFALLTRAGLIPASVCEACNDITARTEANLRRKAAAV